MSRNRLKRVFQTKSTSERRARLSVEALEDRLTPSAGVSRRGGTEAEHKRVMDRLQRDYRYAAGLPEEDGFLAMLERNKARRPQGNG